MRTSSKIGLAVAAVLAVASLAPASSNLQRPIPRQHGAQPAAHVNPGTLTAMRGLVSGPRRFIPDTSSGSPTIFVSDAGASANAVYGFSSPSSGVVWSVSSGISEPQGLATDPSGNLYLANTNDSQVLVFTPPSTTPTNTIADPGYFPVDAAPQVSKKGVLSAIWVSNICAAPACGAGTGNLQEYSTSGTLMQTITCTGLARDYFVAVDEKGNVAIDGENSGAGAVLYYIKTGTSTCSQIVPPFGTTISSPGGVQFTTKGDVSMLDQGKDRILVFKPKNGKLISTTDLSGVSDPVCDALTSGDSDVWTANAGSLTATEFAFPAGGSAAASISGFQEPIGVAVLPPALGK